MGILSAHALVGTGGSGKTKAGFEMGGRPLGLAALSLSLSLFPATPLQHPYSTYPTSDLSPHFNIQGTAHTTPSCLSDYCLSFILTLYANPHHLKGTYLLSQLILIDLSGMGKSKERMKGDGGETAPPPPDCESPPPG